MIQRIQTIYLLLIAGLMLAMLFLPVTIIEGNYFVFRGVGLAVALLSFITIFNYKCRNRQVKLCYGILFLLLLSYAGLFFDLGSIDLFTGGISGLKIAVIFPMVAVILDLMAIGAIKKDEKLVRSADRLR